MFDRIVEEKILESIREGRFDNLQGKGNPIRWEENPFEREDLRLTHHILKENGFPPKWLEMFHNIESGVARLRRMLTVYLDHTENRDLKAKIEQEFSQLNSKIMDYNLLVPLPALQRPYLSFEKERMNIIERDNVQINRMRDVASFVP
jgi:hypothetical protein